MNPPTWKKMVELKCSNVKVWRLLGRIMHFKLWLNLLVVDILDVLLTSALCTWRWEQQSYQETSSIFVFIFISISIIITIKPQQLKKMQWWTHKFFDLELTLMWGFWNRHLYKNYVQFLHVASLWISKSRFSGFLITENGVSGFGDFGGIFPLFCWCFRISRLGFEIWNW